MTIETPWKPTREQLLAANGKGHSRSHRARSKGAVLRDQSGPLFRGRFDIISLGRGIASGQRCIAAGSRRGNFRRSKSAKLLELGYGITNVVKRGTAAADELTAEELEHGAKALHRKIKRYKPKFFAILGIGAYRTGFSRPKATMGLQAETIGESRLRAAESERIECELPGSSARGCLQRAEKDGGMMRLAIVTSIVALFVLPIHAAEPFTLEKDTGYRGIWYKIAQKTEIKYSGGMATYPQQIRPFAIYSKEVEQNVLRLRRTIEGEERVAAHDFVFRSRHRDGPTTANPAEQADGDQRARQPAIAIDSAGYIWIFSNTHGPEKRSYIHRSTKPYSIDAFEQITQTSFSYGQPWYLAGQGFCSSTIVTPTAGRSRFRPARMAANGRRQVAGAVSKGITRSAPSPDGKKLGVAFDYHPHGLDTRTNLYYIETSDFGTTWHNMQGEKLDVPLKEVKNAALVHDYESEGCSISEGHPVRRERPADHRLPHEQESHAE